MSENEHKEGSRIRFALEDDTKVLVLLDGKEVGHIFSPATTVKNKECAIQVCGFEEAHQLWGCGIYGEEIDAPVRRAFDDRIKRTDTANKYRMKKDIQLVFTPYAQIAGFDNDGWSLLNGSVPDTRCYSNPCICENKDPNELPFKVKTHKA